MRAARRHWVVSSGAAISALLIHVLIVAPFVFGSSARRHRPAPDQPGAGASALRSAAQVVEAMTLVDLLHSDDSEEPPVEELASLGIELPQSAFVIASPEPTPPPLLDLSEEGDTTEAAGDTQGHAAMFGRYLGQITARIERAWTRPRVSIEAPRFSCQAKIEQDSDGRVLSVELRHCNGEASWHRSLVSAIEHASPLPAPPLPSVFARMLVLNFSSDTWQEGVSNPHMYETEVRVAAVERSMQLPVVTNPDKNLADVPSHRGHIELRIEGDKLQWTLHDPVAEREQVSAEAK